MRCAPPTAAVTARKRLASPSAVACRNAPGGAATNALPKKMPIVKMVWVGKLRGPLSQFAPDAETRKQFNATTNTATGVVNRVVRQYGACIAMDNGGADTLKAYTAHPYHAEWTAAYEKVRVAGTTTYDIIGQ